MIRPPTDIVLDVARNAEPARLAAAESALGAPASGATQIASAAPSPFDVALRRAGESAPRGDGGAAAAYRGVEEALLARLVEAMLPASPDLYGGGGAGRMWRGFLAEHVSKSMAQGQGLGVAARIGEAHRARLEAASLVGARALPT
jgi:hypothetical protein